MNLNSIQLEIIADTRNLVMLIQFLNYVQKLDFEVKYLDQIPYRVVVFRLQDFLQVQNRSNEQYQLVKVKKFSRCTFGKISQSSKVLCKLGLVSSRIILL